MSDDRAFLGRGWAFPPEFERRGKRAVMVSEEEDIQQSLHILLSTAPGERLMHPTYGCGLRGLVFESVNEATRTEIRDVVEKAILFFEPRITLNHVEIDFVDPLEGRLDLVLDYTIRGTNSRANMVYLFYIHEGINLQVEL
jgi:phage baseplate assembly protein W